MSDKIYDVIIVGSGPAGTHSAFPLVEKGLRVAMIDGGLVSNSNIDAKYTGNFEDIRKKRNDQYELFLGKELNGLIEDKDNSQSIAMVSGNRSYVLDKADEYLPVSTKRVQFVQSLAKGGLSQAWGAACDIFTNQELETVGIPCENMHIHYQKVINRIGISGEIVGYETQKNANIDDNGREILSRFKGNKKLAQEKLYIKRPLLAVVTKDFKGRKPLAYKDLEYYLNVGNSIYRSRFTIEELQENSNFDYISYAIVSRIEKIGNIQKVIVKHFEKNKTYEKEYHAKYVILAAGNVNTTKILLKSLGLYEVKVPFITKTHYILPSLNWRHIGKKGDVERYSLCQLVIDDKETYKGVRRSFSQIYSYKSLMLYKLLKYSPLAIPETMSLLSMFLPSIVLIDFRIPSFKNKNNTMFLQKQEPNDVMHIEGKEIEKEEVKLNLIKTKKFLRKLGLLPIKSVLTPLGSIIHYGGGVPVTEEKNVPLKATPTGQLVGWDGVYIADTATWSALPAHPPTLTIMANANRVGEEVFKDWQKSK